MKIKNKLSINEIKKLTLPCKAWTAQGDELTVNAIYQSKIAIHYIDNISLHTAVEDIGFLSRNYLFEVDMPRMISRYIFTDLEDKSTWKDSRYYTDNGECDKSRDISVFWDETRYARIKVGEEITCKW